MRRPQQQARANQDRRDSGPSEGKVKICYVINERGGRNFWNKIGVAFTNQDGSINVKLDALPVGGDFQIRDYVPREEGDNSQG